VTLDGTFATLLDRLDSRGMRAAGVLGWSSPIPAFGDIAHARVATLGLNPSNREFVDEAGIELSGRHRRFHTLRSLGLSGWPDADSRHLSLMIAACTMYFQRNPYDRWFRILDAVIGGSNASYYGTRGRACHLDLIPYATSEKWTSLARSQRAVLTTAAHGTLGHLLRDSSIHTLILNGRSVVEQFEEAAEARLERRQMRSWALRRNSGADVPGISYRGDVERFGGTHLGRRLLVLGFNHNLQSSFGVTTTVLSAVRSWLTSESRS
jgi:hypothetical protein